MGKSINSKNNESTDNKYLAAVNEAFEKGQGGFSIDFSKALSVQEQIEVSKANTLNEGLRIDQNLKKLSLKLLFVFLGIETFVIFLFTFFQAINDPFNFKLEEWTFRLLVTVSITQITLMLQVAIKYLFPTKEEIKQVEP